MSVTQPFQHKLYHLSLKLSTKFSLFREIRTKAEVQTTISHLLALMHSGGIYTRAQGRQLKWQNLHICNRKIYQGRRINALIWMTQKINLFPLLLTSCHLTSQRRLRTFISPSSNSSTQQMHQWVGDNTRLELGSTRNREMPLARGSSLLSTQQLLLTAV